MKNNKKIKRYMKLRDIKFNIREYKVCKECLELCYHAEQQCPHCGEYGNFIQDKCTNEWWLNHTLSCFPNKNENYLLDIKFKVRG